MSMMSHDAASFRSAAALAPFAFDDPSSQQPDEGYAFETALCLVESLSPSLRPASDTFAQAISATLEQGEARVLSDRARLLETLLAGVRDRLDAGEWRVLLDAADRVAGELAAALSQQAAAKRGAAIATLV